MNRAGHNSHKFSDRPSVYTRRIFIIMLLDEAFGDVVALTPDPRKSCEV